MLTGFPTGCSTGHNEELLLGFNPVGVDALHLMLPLQAAPGCGDQQYAYGADGRTAAIITLAEGAAVVKKFVTVDAKKIGHSIFCEPLGLWTNVGEVVVSEPTGVLSGQSGQSYEEDFDVSSVIVGSAGDKQQLDTWVLNGVSRWTTCRARSVKNEGELDVTLTKVGSVRTVTVGLNGRIFASGSRSGDGAIVLSEQSASGVSGSVNVTWTADVECIVVKRWASSYVLTAAGVSQIVTDPGQGERLKGIVGPLSVGSTNLVNTPYSDTGVAGAGTTTAIVVPGPPLPVTNLALASGTQYDNLVLQFNASLSVGATYRLYMSVIGGPVDVSDVAATLGAQTAGALVTLAVPAFAGVGAAGRAWAMIETVNGGLEDGLRFKFAIDFKADGTLYLPPPNVPTVRPAAYQPVTAGDHAHLTYSYDRTGELGVGSTVTIEYQAEDLSGGFSTPVLIATSRQSSGDVTITLTNNLFYRFRAYASTAGAVQSPNSDWTEWVFVSTDPLPAPGNVDVFPVG